MPNEPSWKVGVSPAKCAARTRRPRAEASETGSVEFRRGECEQKVEACVSIRSSLDSFCYTD